MNKLFHSLDIGSPILMRQPYGSKGRTVHLGTDRIRNVVAQNCISLGLHDFHQDPQRHNLTGGQLPGSRLEGQSFMSDGGKGQIGNA
jgi:hypothetical protein